MTIDEAFTAVESPAFVVQANLAIGDAHFTKIVYDSPATQALVTSARERLGQRKILLRCLALVRRAVDLRYENPWDTPIAVYVSVLYATSPELAAVAAEVAAHAPATWWARKMAQEVLFANPVETSSGDTKQEFRFGADLPARPLSVVGRPGIQDAEVWIGQLDESPDPIVFGGLVLARTSAAGEFEIWPQAAAA